MRFARDKLIFMALCALEDWRERGNSGPVTPDFGLRVVLAVLFALGKSGSREHYDRFWRNLTEPYSNAHSDVTGNVFRSNEAHACFEWITQDVGAPQDMEYRTRMYAALRGRSSKPRPPGG
jgi:hypothetical protein